MTDAAHRAPLFRNRDFVCLTGAQALSITGREIEGLVLPLLVLGLTGSPAQVGLVAAAQSLPYLLLSLPAGALIDRSSRRRVMMLCEAVRALAFATLPIAWAMGSARSWSRSTSSPWWPAPPSCSTTSPKSARCRWWWIRPTCPRPRRPTPWSSGSARTPVPRSAEVLTGLGRTTVAGAMLAYAVQAGMLASSLGFLGAIQASMQAEPTQKPRASLLTEMIEGVRWLLGHPQVRAMALLAMALNLLFSPVTLAIIVLARGGFHAPPALIGLMFTAGGAAGLVATTLASPWVRRRVELGHLITGGVVIWAVGLACVAASTSMLMLALAWAIMPAISGIQDVAGVSYRLSLIPEAMQGRVNSVFRFMAWGIRPGPLWRLAACW